MKTMMRSEALALLRCKCMALVDDENSLCQVASELRILCKGFSQWSFHELKERYEWIARNRPGITRGELEDLANRWQLARQFVHDSDLSCDTQMLEKHHKICDGWATYSNEDLGRFCHEMIGEEVEVVPDTSEALG